MGNFVDLLESKGFNSVEINQIGELSELNYNEGECKLILDILEIIFPQDFKGIVLSCPKILEKGNGNKISSFLNMMEEEFPKTYKKIVLDDPNILIGGGVKQMIGGKDFLNESENV